MEAYQTQHHLSNNPEIASYEVILSIRLRTVAQLMEHAIVYILEKHVDVSFVHRKAWFLFFPV